MKMDNNILMDQIDTVSLSSQNIVLLTDEFVTLQLLELWEAVLSNYVFHF